MGNLLPCYKTQLHREKFLVLLEMRYSRLPDSSSHAGNQNELDNENDVEEIELSGIANPIHSSNIPVNTVSNEFQLRVLYRENSIDITNLTCNSTVGRLKEVIYEKTEITPANQRLIYSGRLIQPDTITLQSFGIETEAKIHLFPRPITATASPITGPGNGNTITVQAQPLTVTGVNPVSTSYESEDGITADAREVRLWSSLLFFLSVMTVANNFAHFVTAGNFGVTFLDGIVNFLDTVCSIAGIYVSQLGLTVVRTYDIAAIEKYVKQLTILAVCCLGMRLLWIFDIIFQVEQAVKDSRSGKDVSKTDDDFYSKQLDDQAQPHQQPLSNRVVVTFGLQVRESDIDQGNTVSLFLIGCNYWSNLCYVLV